MKRVRKGDQVIVITGKARGQKGEILKIMDDRVIVQNINLVSRHTKPNPQRNQLGGIIERESSIHISNVMPLNAALNKGERIGYKSLVDGRKVRIYRSNSEIIDT